ncbi:MAG TPA: hypothetical protein VMS56_12370 [Thermoanaerobaculia bacterium]|nr:hypothetical protein [Thermoanaerobaculia bacterium]
MSAQARSGRRGRAPVRSPAFRLPQKKDPGVAAGVSMFILDGWWNAMGLDFGGEISEDSSGDVSIGWQE